MRDTEFKIVMLCGRGLSSRIMYNGLAREFDISAVIVEKKPAALHTIRRRIKKLGLFKVMGQLGFMALNRWVLLKRHKARIAELIAQYHLNTQEPPRSLVEHVDSINDKSVIAALKRLNPDAVVVNGTRIISTTVLKSIDSPFINTHVGMTPRYRGVHGGYWALVNRDPAHCGVTVHLVDAGIDTGEVLYQDKISVGAKDGFNTYPIHQIAKAIPLVKAALDDIVENRLEPVPGIPPSRLWSHPTLFQYLVNRIYLGVR